MPFAREQEREEDAIKVVVGHGFSHTAREWVTHGILQEIASHGAITVAMNYSETFVGYSRGAAEVLVVARHFRLRHPVETACLFGASMGGGITGMALAESRGLFDYWVDVEGLTNLSETWAEARAVGASCGEALLDPTGVGCFARDVADHIESETGGIPATVPQEYARRSPAPRGGEIAASGVRGAVVVHAVNDWLVPYNQGRETVEALVLNGVPVHFYSVLRGPCGDQGDTHIVPPLDPVCLAGHGSEIHPERVVIRTGLQALIELIAGTRVPDHYQEFVVDNPTP
ncbi:MAG TPA: hypothetical protein VNL14_17040 [Candidatus Acidoferrales bacterium]|nr:hypothetical protein [Candidatus Acidoferrales bacterium]